MDNFNLDSREGITTYNIEIKAGYRYNVTASIDVDVPTCRNWPDECYEETEEVEEEPEGENETSEEPERIME